MKFLRLKLRRIRNDEWFQFMTEFKTLVERFDPQVLNIGPLFASFLTLYAEADETMVIIRKSAASDQMVDADSLRDRTFRGFADGINSLLNHFDPVRQQAAQRIKIVLNTYGNLASLPYNEETSRLTNLLQELSGPKANDISTLAMGDWLTKLQAANNAFEALVQSRNTELSGKSELKMVEVRRQADAVYRNILERIEAFITLGEEVKYTPFVSELNGYIDRQTNALAHRAAKPKEEKPL